MTLLVNVNGKGAVEIDFEIEEWGENWCEHAEATLKMALSSWVSTHGGDAPDHMELLELLNSVDSLTPEDESWSVTRSTDLHFEASVESEMYVRFSFEGFAYLCVRR